MRVHREGALLRQTQPGSRRHHLRSRLRSTNPALHLIAVEPYPGFSAKSNEEWQTSYREMLQGAALQKLMGKQS